MAGLPFHEFFAGSGLVSIGLSPTFEAVWANDISEIKASVYRQNCNGSVLHVGDIAQVSSETLPKAMLSWASFPCQDLSLAGKIGGINAERSGLVWQWMRIIDQLGDAAPRVICLENVTGLVSSRQGADYRHLHRELEQRGYSTGAIAINASLFVPQSRPRIFVIGTKGPLPTNLLSDGPTWLHTGAIVRAASECSDFVWWSAPKPPKPLKTLEDILDRDAEFNRDDVVTLIPQAHRDKFLESGLKYATAYRRTRNHRQVLEIRCDGIAGCLRTPGGGSSRQYVVERAGDSIHARLLTAREAARLMGAPESFVLPDSYNEAYIAMGDAVAAPVAHWISENIISRLVRAAYGLDERS